jgi:hypothetical protein
MRINSTRTAQRKIDKAFLFKENWFAKVECLKKKMKERHKDIRMG